MIGDWKVHKLWDIGCWCPQTVFLRDKHNSLLLTVFRGICNDSCGSRGKELKRSKIVPIKSLLLTSNYLSINTFDLSSTG